MAIRLQPGEGQVVSVLTSIFKSECTRLVAQVFAEGADRHGSLVWEAGWENNGHRFITLAATWHGADTWRTEVWAAASDDHAYTRRLTYQDDISIAEVVLPGAFHRRISEAIRRAADIAVSIQAGDPDVLFVASPSDIPGTEEPVVGRR